MRQSLFADEPLVLPEANLVAGGTACHTPPLVARPRRRGGLVALIPLALVLLK